MVESKPKVFFQEPTDQMVEAAYPLLDTMPSDTPDRRRRLVRAIFREMWANAEAPKETGLPDRQAAVQLFIATFIKLHGKSPTLQEIANGCGLCDRQHAFLLVAALRRKGIVERPERHQARGIRLAVYPGQPIPNK